MFSCLLFLQRCFTIYILDLLCLCSVSGTVSNSLYLYLHLLFFLRPCMLYLFPPGFFFLNFYFISCVYFITFFLSFSNFEIHSSVFYVVSSFWSLLANFEIIVYCLRLFVMGEVLYFVACFHGLSRCYSALFSPSFSF